VSTDAGGGGSRPPDDHGGGRPDDPDRTRTQHDTDPLPILRRPMGTAPVSPPPGGGQGWGSGFWSDLFGRWRSRRADQDAYVQDTYVEVTDPLEVPDVEVPIVVGPSPVVSRYLFSSERFCGEWRRHWTILWKQAFGVVLATFLLGLLAGTTNGTGMVLGVATAVWFAVLLWALWGVGDWYYDRFVLTSRRVMVVMGVFDRRVAMMPLARVTDMAYNQSALGRILGYGTFIIESAGQEQALREVDHLPHPRDLYLLMLDEMYGPDPRPKPTRTRRDSTSAGD
jgi:hypothetical protein